MFEGKGLGFPRYGLFTPLHLTPGAGLVPKPTQWNFRHVSRDTARESVVIALFKGRASASPELAAKNWRDKLTCQHLICRSSTVETVGRGKGMEPESYRN